MTRSTPPRPEGLDPALSRWLDGASSAGETRAVEARLAADPRLAAEVERLRGDMDLWRADALPRSASAVGDAGLADRVLAEVAARRGEASEGERFRRLARRWSAAAAVLIAVGVAGSIAVRPPAPAAVAGDPGVLTSLVEARRVRAEVDRVLVQPSLSPSDR